MKLNKLTIKNFKGLKSFEFVPAGGSAIVRGANGTGKTTIYDAINWLFFGKDSTDAEKFGIRPVGCDKEASTEVSAELAGDDRPVTIKKTLVEKWVKPRGQAEEVYKGTETTTEWNGVPVKREEWNANVSALFNGADEAVVKICTNTAQFFRLKWQMQRELLTSIAGEPTDEELAFGPGGEEVAEYLRELDGRKEAEYRAHLKSEIKKLSEKAVGIPARIEELTGMKKQPNHDAEAQLEQTKAEIEEVKKAIAGEKEARAAIEAEAAGVQKEINELSDRIFTAQRKAKQEAAERADKLAAAERDIRTLQKMQADGDSAYKALLGQKDALISEWETATAESYTGDGICPHCGQPLPAEMLEKSLAKFNTEKAERIKSIETRGADLNERIKYAEGSNTKRKAEIAAKEADVANLKAEVEGYKPADVSGLEKQKQELRDRLAGMQANSTAANLIERQQELMRKADVLKADAGVYTFNADIDKRVEQLREEQHSIAATIAKLEGAQYRAEQYSRKKIQAVEDRVNSLFTNVRFKMFEYTIDGNPVDTCKATVNGVDYQDLNTASKVNAGLEIISAFSKHYGIEAPVVIDNRESVTRILETGLQTFSLVVAPEETELKVINQ